MRAIFKWRIKRKIELYLCPILWLFGNSWVVHISIFEHDWVIHISIFMMCASRKPIWTKIWMFEPWIIFTLITRFWRCRYVEYELLISSLIAASNSYPFVVSFFQKYRTRNLVCTNVGGYEPPSPPRSTQMLSVWAFACLERVAMWVR